MFDSYDLLPPDEAKDICRSLRSLGWDQGKARTKGATGTIKRNLEIKSPGQPPEADNTEEATKRELVGRVLSAITGDNDLIADHSVKRFVTPKFNLYRRSGEYRRHGDAAVMNGVRTDIAMTLFLSSPDDYEGGDLCVESPDGNYHKIKGAPGTAVVYPCYMPHWVEPVTAGARIAAISWFESGYRDFGQRMMMRRLLRVLREMEQDPEQVYGDWYTSLGTIHGQLQRMWLDHEVPPTH